MTAETNCRQAYSAVSSKKAFSKGNLDALDPLFAPNFQEHQPGMVPPNLEGVKGAIAYLRSVFPDLTLTIEDSVASRRQGVGAHHGARHAAWAADGQAAKRPNVCHHRDRHCTV